MLFRYFVDRVRSVRRAGKVDLQEPFLPGRDVLRDQWITRYDHQHVQRPTCTPWPPVPLEGAGQELFQRGADVEEDEATRFLGDQQRMVYFAERTYSRLSLQPQFPEFPRPRICRVTICDEYFVWPGFRARKGCLFVQAVPEKSSQRRAMVRLIHFSTNQRPAISSYV